MFVVHLSVFLECTSKKPATKSKDKLAMVKLSTECEIREFLNVQFYPISKIKEKYLFQSGKKKVAFPLPK